MSQGKPNILMVFLYNIYHYYWHLEGGRLECYPPPLFRVFVLTILLAGQKMLCVRAFMCVCYHFILFDVIVLGRILAIGRTADGAMNA